MNNPIRLTDPDGMMDNLTLAQAQQMENDEAYAWGQAKAQEQVNDALNKINNTGDNECCDVKLDHLAYSHQQLFKGKRIKHKKLTESDLLKLLTFIDAFMKRKGYEWDTQKGGFVITTEGGHGPVPYGPGAKVSNADRIDLTGVLDLMVTGKGFESHAEMIMQFRSNFDAINDLLPKYEETKVQAPTSSNKDSTVYVDEKNHDTLTENQVNNNHEIYIYLKTHTLIPDPSGGGHDSFKPIKIPKKSK